MKQKGKRTLRPKLRFPEFRDQPGWEEKNLSEITSAIFDGTHQTPTYTEAGIPFYSVENLISGNANKFISREDYDLATRNNKPEKGDILLTRIGKIGFSQVVTWGHEFSVYVTLAVIKRSSQFNSYYLHCLMQTYFYQSELRSKSLSNAVPPKINMDSLRETKVFLPMPAEQQKIAECLSSLDGLIDAEGRKLEALKAHKKGLMQQLFPQPGQTQPRLRFPEFRDKGEWVANKLSEITSAIFDGTHQTPTYTESGIPFYSVENLISGIANKFISKEDYDLATRKNKPEKDDILLTRIGKIGFSQVVTWDHEFSVYVTLAVIKRSSQFNSFYLHCLMHSNFYQSEFREPDLLNFSKIVNPILFAYIPID